MKRLLVLFSILAEFYCVKGQASQKVTIYFPFNKYYITNGAAEILDKAIKENAGKTIDAVKIYAYCDSIGGLLANDTLAINRTNAVKAYLLNHQIGNNNFKEIKGFGKRVPVNDNSNDSLRALNRRAEIIIFAHAFSIKDSLRGIMNTIRAGEKFGLPSLNFYGGRHLLIPESAPILDTLVAILKLYSKMEIEVQGYVCCVPVGQEGYDVDDRRWQLSTSRARAIYNYLLAKGIAAGRLSYKGYGNRPLVIETNEADRAANRRVEIKVLKR